MLSHKQFCISGCIISPSVPPITQVFEGCEIETMFVTFPVSVIKYYEKKQPDGKGVYFGSKHKVAAHPGS